MITTKPSFSNTQQEDKLLNPHQSQAINKELLDFIAHAPTQYHAVLQAKQKLDSKGFTQLHEFDSWNLKPSQGYYVVRDDASLIAFKTPVQLSHYQFQITAAHTDSPTFKIKARPTLQDSAPYTRLNLEAYGGMLDYTWFDRPLHLAGRVLVKRDDRIQTQLIHTKEPVAIIPSVAIHLMRTLPQNGFNHRIDLPALFGQQLSEDAFLHRIAQEIKGDPQEILGFDLFVALGEKGLVWGENKQFVSSPKLDDLQGVFTTLKGFLQAKDASHISVCALFDNEEVGSQTNHGALSTFLKDTLERINLSLKKDPQELLQAYARSFMVSCDNAHALHPNHPELYDKDNRPLMNAGIVIKESANQLYTTNAYSRAVFVQLLENANIPYQVFANASDRQGGSTLGNLSNTQVSLPALDVGFAQLAMHSSFETAGALDSAWGVEAFSHFFGTTIETSTEGVKLLG